MSQEPAPHIRNLRRWPLLAIAIAAVLLMPVEYRAGAQAPHPHAVLQLAWEASSGTPRHHHVRKAIHPCVFAARSLSMSIHGSMNHRERVDTRAPGDIADPSIGTKSTTTVLAATLLPLLACLMQISRPSRRQPTGSISPPAGVALVPSVPPPKR